MNRRLSVLTGLVAFSTAMAMSVWAGSVVTATAGSPAVSVARETKPAPAAGELKTSVKKSVPEARATLPVISDAGNLPITEASVDPEPILIQPGDGGAQGVTGSGDRGDIQPGLTAAKPTLGDAIVSQQSLHVYLDQPATISLYSARGQLIYRLESNRRMEVLPLAGQSTGFLYLTLRAGPFELTKKLVYSGR